MGEWIQRDGYRYFKTADGVPGDAVPFVIPGLVASTLTLFYGRPKTGKSTLASAVVRSVATGVPVVDETPALTGPVAVISGDPGDAVLVYGRMLDGLPDTRVFEFSRPPTDAAWGTVIGELNAQGCRVAVVDNLMAFTPGEGDVNEQRAFRHLADILDPLIRGGTAVILVHHLSEHAYSTKPLGHTSISAGARWSVRFERRSDDLVLHRHGTYGAESELTVSPPDGTTDFLVISATGSDELSQRRKKRQHDRDEMTREHRKEIAQFVLAECQGKSARETGEKIAGRFKGAAGTHRNRLGDGGYGVCKADDGRWVRANGEGGTVAQLHP